MATKLKIEKRGDEILKESSPLFHQHLVLIEQMVSDKKIFMGISHRVLCLTYITGFFMNFELLPILTYYAN
jgi:hypothetical protein